MKCKCGETDPNKFYLSKQSYCKSCDKLYKQANHDKVLAYKKKYYWSNYAKLREKYKQSQLVLSPEKRAKRILHQKLYREQPAIKEHRKDIQRKWRRNNPDYPAMRKFFRFRNILLSEVPKDIQVQYRTLHKLKRIIRGQNNEQHT
jgi:hypothetical protein